MQAIGENDVPIEESDMDSYVEEEIKPGTLVWGKVVGYPYWPAVIEPDPDERCYIKDLMTTPKYHVVFLGDPPSRAWLTRTFIRSFDMSPPIGPRRKYLNSRKYKIAVLEADGASRMNNKERLAKYSYSVQKRRKEQEKAKRVKKTSKTPKDEPAEVQIEECEARLQEEASGDERQVSHYVASRSTILEYIPGSLVWAKLVGHPYWPAIVENDPNYGLFFKERATLQEYHVVFLDTPPSRSWIGKPYLRSFNSSPPPEKRKQRLSAKKYKSAVDEAKKASKMSMQVRLDTYSFVIRRKKSLEDRRLKRKQTAQKNNGEPPATKTAPTHKKEEEETREPPATKTAPTHKKEEETKTYISVTPREEVKLLRKAAAGQPSGQKEEMEREGSSTSEKKEEELEESTSSENMEEEPVQFNLEGAMNEIELEPEKPKDHPLWMQEIIQKHADLPTNASINRSTNGNLRRKSKGLQGSEKVMKTDVVNSSNSIELKNNSEVAVSDKPSTAVPT